MKETIIKVCAKWLDLLYNWRRNQLSFFITEAGDLKLVSDDDWFNFMAPEDDEIVAKVLLGFPSEDFEIWMRANVCGMKVAKVYSVEYEVSPTGKVIFDLTSFKSKSWDH